MIRTKRSLTVLLGTMFLSLSMGGRFAGAGMVDWPRRIGLPGGRAVLYEPKVKKHEGNEIEAVAAVSFLIRDATTPVLGTVRFTGRILTEQDSEMATLEIDRVIEAEFPAGPDGDGIDPAILARSEMPRWNLPMTVEGYHSLLSGARAGRAIVGSGTESPQPPTKPDLRPSPPEYTSLAIMTSVHPKANFPPSGTFHIRSIEVPPELKDRETVTKRLRQALTRHLTEEGYRYEPSSEDPAFLVDASLSFRQDREGTGAPPGNPPENNREELGGGYLTVEIRDPATDRRMWRGVVEARGMLDTTDEEKDHRVDFVVGRMLAGFPPEQPEISPAGMGP
jgi:hypothetical protein